MGFVISFTVVLFEAKDGHPGAYLSRLGAKMLIKEDRLQAWKVNLGIGFLFCVFLSHKFNSRRSFKSLCLSLHH
jgi:hypothetical protein